MIKKCNVADTGWSNALVSGTVISQQQLQRGHSESSVDTPLGQKEHITTFFPRCRGLPYRHGHGIDMRGD